MGPVGAQNDRCAPRTPPIAVFDLLSRIPHVEHTNRAHEIELWPADVNVSALLCKVQSIVFYGFLGCRYVDVKRGRNRRVPGVYLTRRKTLR